MGKLNEHTLTLFGEARRELATAKRALRYSPDASEVTRAIRSAWQALVQAGGLGPTARERDELARPPHLLTPLELRDQIDSLSRSMASRERAQRAGSAWTQRVRRPSLPAVLALAASAALALTALSAQPRTPRPWRASYHAGLELAGEAIVRHQSELDFRWQRRSPVPGLDADRFSVRWDTCLTIPQASRSNTESRTQADSGLSQLNFSLRSDDGARLWLDDQIVMDSWKSRGPSQRSGEVSIAPGRHHLRVEYRELKGAASISLDIEQAGRRVTNEWLAAPPEPFRPQDACGLAAGRPRP